MEINRPGDNERKEGDNEATCLTVFLYALYLRFGLENNALETFVGPRDEVTILRLALARVTEDAEVSDQ